MNFRIRFATALLGASALFPALGFAQHYTQKNLVSDLTSPPSGDQTVAHVDANLVNPWGITRNSGGPWWISDNNSGKSTIYDGNGVPSTFLPDPAGSTFDNFIFVAAPKGAPNGFVSAPTGIVYNGNPNIFMVSLGGVSGPAAFIYCTEDGTISGWSPGVDVIPPAKLSINSVLAVDNSDNGSPNGAVYKGCSTAEWKGNTYLYVTNFRDAHVEVYDSNFHRVYLDNDAFDDDSIPRGFAPFNIQNIGGSLFVTYAKQNAQRHDDVAGPGNGFVDIYSPSGKLQGHLEHGDWMNSPWGVVWTPRDFGRFSNSILVGNFRSGWVAAFNGFTHEFIGFVQNPDNSLVFIDGLWSLAFGNGGSAGPATTLYFTAGLESETHGLFGTLTPVSSEQDGSVE